MQFSRSSGILMHPSSLPGQYGIGTLGAEARAFVDFLAEAGQKLWQILPLGPTGYGDSPYQSTSAFAGNPYLIDPEMLAGEGLLTEGELAAARQANSGRVDFGRMYLTRPALLEVAWRRFAGAGAGTGTDVNAGAITQAGFDAFKADNSGWLDDFALFSAIKELHSDASWDSWPASLRSRAPSALGAFRRDHADIVDRHAWIQYVFDLQWKALKACANSRGVKIVGDIPIFAAYDSADVWADPQLFQLDGSLNPRAVAGVPPDYFTADGQLWGNPLYDWEKMKAAGYHWWTARMRRTLEMVDMVRIDHFRGFYSNWAVPFGDRTAVRGIWEKGPGAELFRAIEAKLGSMPVIAEDLGFMTPEVEAMRDSLGYPGMRILQFAFNGPEECADHPHLYPLNSVVYTGTHDNETTRGWFEAASPGARRRALAYARATPSTFAWDLISTAWASRSVIAIAPMQDFLNLNSAARMNFPGTTGGHWTWRMADGAATPLLARRIRELTETYFR
ncbi:MAG: 4-alpha-glucanotransferase [Rectinemataceae bacterium]